MKFKALILIAFAAVITLSFSFAANKNSTEIVAIESSASETSQPFEGFISEDKF